MNPMLKEMILDALRQALKLEYSQAYDEMDFAGALQLAGGVVSDLEDLDLIVEVQKMINELTTTL